MFKVYITNVHEIYYSNTLNKCTLNQNPRPNYTL